MQFDSILFLDSCKSLILPREFSYNFQRVKYSCLALTMMMSSSTDTNARMRFGRMSHESSVFRCIASPQIALVSSMRYVEVCVDDVDIASISVCHVKYMLACFRFMISIALFLPETLEASEARNDAWASAVVPGTRPADLTACLEYRQ